MFHVVALCDHWGVVVSGRVRMVALGQVGHG